MIKIYNSKSSGKIVLPQFFMKNFYNLQITIKIFLQTKNQGVEDFHLSWFYFLNLIRPKSLDNNREFHL